MPESVNGGNSNPAQPPQKELSMEMRLLLAFILMGAVMFVTPYFFKQSPPPKGAKPAAEQTGGAAATPSAPKEASAPPPAAIPAVETAPAATTAPVAGATNAQPAGPVSIDTDLFRVVFSNQGASVRSWTLKKYRGNDGKLLDLANIQAADKFGAPLSLSFPAQKPTSDVNKVYYKQTADPDGLGVAYEFSDGHTLVRKTFRFQKSSYLLQVTAEVSIDGKPVPSMLEWRGGFGDLTVPSPASAERTLYFDVATNKLVQHSAGDAKNGPVSAEGNFSFAGIADTYFAAVFLPADNSPMQVASVQDKIRAPQEETEFDFPGIQLTDGQANHFDLFVGPKDLQLLKSLNPKLEQVVDFGWFSFLARPLFLIVNWSNQTFVHNFGWAIVIVTVVITMAMFPIKLSNMKSMRKMQALKPQIDAINAKYKGVSMRDPKAADKNQEVMDLYKKYGVNPMGGCVPMLLQLPFFYAFYKVFTVSVEMRGASWLWVTDLSQPEHFAIKILPIAMIVSQFLMQKMTPQATGVDPGQQKIMQFMPIIFGVMFYRFPSGLVLYYLTSNLVNMGQQWFFNHTEAAQEAARSVEPPRKKNGRK